MLSEKTDSGSTVWLIENAAKCKVNGQWFPYDSPECSLDSNDNGNIPEPISDDREPLYSPSPATQTYSQLKSIPSYAKPWPEVNYEIEQKCKQYNSQPLGPERCRIREERGYWSMKSSFGLPEAVALEAKAHCVTKSDTLSAQIRCLESEAIGYFIFTLEYAMPANYRGEAKAKCLREHSTYAERGNCMTGEETVFAKKYGHQFYKPRKIGRSWTKPRQPMVMSRAGFSQGPSWTEVIGRFEADPEHRLPTQLAMNQSDPPFPLPFTTVGVQLGVIDSDSKSGQLTSHQFDLIVKKLHESTDRFSLDMQEPEVENRGFLELVAPSTVDPRRGAFFTAGSAGQVILLLYVEKGRTYLVDFAVNSWEKARYRVTAESGDQMYDYDEEKCCHLLARIKANSLGWTQLTLTQDTGPGFYLHSIDVTLTPRSDWTPESVPADGKRK